MKRHKSTKPQQVLVTGGLGFIGKHLCVKLLSLGYTVTSLDNESASSEDALDFILDGQSSWQERFQRVNGSTLDKELVQTLMTPDTSIVFHLAASLGVENVVKNRLQTLESNVLGTKNVLDAASRSKPASVFIASSSEVYGKNDAIPFKESSDLTLGPSSISRWGYAASKIMCEHEALARHEESHLPVVIGRFFNVVGPGQRPESGMVIPKMISAAQKGLPISVLGNGQQRRCFCHVDDAIEAMCSLMLSERSKAYGEIFNIGNPDNEISMLDLGKQVKQICHSNSEVKLVPYEKIFKLGSFEDMTRRVPDTMKISGMTGWRPKKSLHEILEDSLKHY